MQYRDKSQFDENYQSVLNFKSGLDEQKLLASKQKAQIEKQREELDF